MARWLVRLVLPLLMLVSLPSRLRATTIVVDFETLSDGLALTNQVSGLTFSNATVLAAGISLDELEAPPHSGSKVIIDDGGPMSIVFSSPVSNVGGYFTYALGSPAKLTLMAFDSSHVALGTATLSSFSNNEGLSGESGSFPNEFLQLPFLDIASVTVLGDPGGFSFLIDDLTFSTATDVPEPTTLSLLLAVGLAWVGHRWSARSRRRDPGAPYRAPTDGHQP